MKTASKMTYTINSAPTNVETCASPADYCVSTKDAAAAAAACVNGSLLQPFNQPTRSFAAFRVGCAPLTQPRRSTPASFLSSDTSSGAGGWPPLPWISGDVVFRQKFSFSVRLSRGRKDGGQRGRLFGVGYHLLRKYTFHDVNI